MDLSLLKALSEADAIACKKKCDLMVWDRC